MSAEEFPRNVFGMFRTRWPFVPSRQALGIREGPGLNIIETTQKKVSTGLAVVSTCVLNCDHSLFKIFSAATPPLILYLCYLAPSKRL